MIEFGWQPMATAPRDGTPFIHIYVVRYCGGGRPDWYQPFAEPIARWWIGGRRGNSDDFGYWSTVAHDRDHGDQLRPLFSVPEMGAHGWWTMPDAYASAVDTMKPWRDAPRDRWIGLAREIKEPGALSLANATVTAVRWGKVPEIEQSRPWGSIEPEAFRTAAGNWCAPGYLDGWNTTGKPYRWCELHELVPGLTHEKQRGGTLEEMRAARTKFSKWNKIDDSAWPELEPMA